MYENAIEPVGADCMRPHCGEMSRSDRGDGHRLGGGNAARRCRRDCSAGGNDKNTHFFVVTLFALLHPE